MARFSDVMRHLNPKVIIEKTEMPHDNARGKYLVKSSMAGSHREFENILIDYVDHHMKETLGFAPAPHYCLDKARRFLESSIGFENAVFIGMSGSEGGMHHVLNQISDGFKQLDKRAYFDYVLDTFVNPLSFPEIVELMQEFKSKLGGYSPQAFGLIQPEAMAANYKQILWSYIDSLTRYRNLWAY